MSNKPQIYYLTLVNKNSYHKFYCKTIAFGLDEAFRRAEQHHGPSQLYSCGTCSLPDDYELVYGSGEFLPSPYDSLLHPQALEAIRA